MHRFSLITSPPGIAIVTFLIFAVGTLSGYHQARLWSQVTDLWDHGWSIANWHKPIAGDTADSERAETIQHAAHRLRFFLTYPLFWTGKALGISADAIFTALVPFLAATTVWATGRVVELRCTGRVSFVGLLCLSPVALVFAAMDGRLIFAHCGYALLLAANLAGGDRGWLWRAIISLGALWLTAVSSGTFYSALAAFIILTALRARQTTDWQSRTQAILPLLWVGIIFQYDLLGALTKNITYYGGGFAGAIGMLRHGFGEVFITIATCDGFWFLVLPTLLLPIWGVYLLLRKAGEPALLLLLVTAVCMGAFGMSMLTLALVPACALASVASNRFFSQNAVNSSPVGREDRLTTK